MEQCKLLIIDQEKQTNNELKKYLEMNGYIVFAVGDEFEAWDIIQKELLDLIIIDWNLPSGSGKLFCHTICNSNKIPMIIVSSIMNEDDMIKGLEIGADDYIFKPYSVKNVAARVKTVLRRIKKGNIENGLFDDGYLYFEPTKRLLYKEGVEVHLTPTEYKLFDTLVRSQNHTFTRNQLISSALGGDFDGYDRSIDSYIKGLRHKIEPDRKKPHYVKTVHGVGYRFQPNK